MLRSRSILSFSKFCGATGAVELARGTLVLENQSLEMAQGYTRSRAELLHALDHVPVALPYKFMNGAFYAERFGQSIDVL